MDQFVFIITSRSAARKKNKPCSKSKFLQNEKQIKKKEKRIKEGIEESVTVATQKGYETNIKKKH